MDRYYAHLDNIALLTTGRPFRVIEADEDWKTFSDALGNDFVRSLDYEQLLQFQADLEREIEVIKSKADV
jgi:hypothetical protein